MRRIYLDHAATTPLDPEVLDAMLPYLRDHFGNPSSVHSFGQRARGAIDEARARVASLVGARDSEIVFTGSGTEADNLAIVGALQAGAATEAARTDLVTSTIEHHAVLNTARGLDRSKHHVALAKVSDAGVVDLHALDAAITAATALVSVMFANNETGVLQPLSDVVRLARSKGALIHTDAVQGLGKVRLDVVSLDVDLMTVSAHKIHGPKGAGALYVRSGTRMTALIRGGSQERNRRAGTENVAGIVGLGKAAELAQARMVQDTRRIEGLRNRLETALIEGIPGRVTRNGSEANRIATTGSLSFKGVSGEDLLIALDLAGIAVSTGAACAAGSPEPSHVLKAMGLPRERVNGSLRFSLGRSTTADEIDHTVEAVTLAVDQLRARP
ncbi:MAG: cysteine desulfurase [Vicinamibacteria bacterium]|nr:cysteine desulfurase [Vicinamibacteria bacterium]